MEVHIKKIKKLFLIAMIGITILLVLWFIPSINASTIELRTYSDGSESYSAITETYSMFSLLSEIIILDILSLLLFILSEIILLFSIKNGIKQKKYHLIVPKISVIHSLFWQICLIALGAAEASEYKDAGAVFGPNFFGIINILLSISILIVLFIISHKTKNLLKKENQSNEENN